MTRHVTDLLGSVRSVAADSRDIEGIAVPYGTVSGETELTPGGEVVREAFMPGAFRASVEHWMTRQDGGRMAFRPAHREKPIGVVTELTDTPAGVGFRASIFEGPAGDEYLGQVRSGLNGVSAEVAFSGTKRMADRTVVHREGRMHAIAGSVSPAYDGARIALRDMEELMNDETPAPTPEPTPAPAPEPAQRDTTSNTVELTPALRSALERFDGGQYRAPAVVTREAQIYRRDATWSGEDERGNRYSFLTDGWKARNGDTTAAERQHRYERMTHDIEVRMEREAQVSERAGDVLSTEIVGAYPNDYVPSLFTPRILKGRPMGSFFTRFPISDALPKIYPKTGTSTTVAVQSAEGANPAASDFTTTAITVTPALYGAETVVSRQVLDGSSPAAESMLLQDMLEAYGQASETVIKTAVEAGATASGTAITAATPYVGATGNVVKYATTRFLAAEGQFVPSALYAVLVVQPDTSSLKPLLAFINPQNADGTINAGGLSADILGAQVFHSYASTTNVVVTARRDDYVIFESAIARFSYDAVTGPSGVRIGIWAYLAAAARKGGLSVTAA